MTDEKLGELLEAFGHHYWSLPMEYVIEKIEEWHPEITSEQFQRVLQYIKEDGFWHHCTIVDEGLEEPELVTEHIIAIDEDDFERFLAARIDAPICECDEATLLKPDGYYLEIPEAKAVFDFGQQELGLDEEWADQLVNDCFLCQPMALCEGRSWVKAVLDSEAFGKIRFQTIDQVERFRGLGNELYQVTPNPVLRGWKPAEIENPPVLPDDIPERAEDIPNCRDDLFAQYGGREKVIQQLRERFSDDAIPKRKIGRNEPCPCGSGKKYKKCCGRNPALIEVEQAKNP